MVRQGSSLTWMSIRIGLQGRKPGESNKLFDLFFPPQDTIRPIRIIRGRKRAASTPVPGGHYLEQPGATPSVYMTHHHTSSWRAIRQRMGRFISVYRLGEDGDLL